LRQGEASCLPDDQARTDTHAIPMGNYVILPVRNYVLTSAPQLGNYVIADTFRDSLHMQLGLRRQHRQTQADRLPQAFNPQL
jgi:hypothetical protein